MVPKKEKRGTINHRTPSILYSDSSLSTNLNRTSFFVPLTTTFSTNAVNSAGSNSRHSSCPASLRVNSDIRFASDYLSTYSHNGIRSSSQKRKKGRPKPAPPGYTGYIVHSVPSRRMNVSPSPTTTLSTRARKRSPRFSMLSPSV